MVGKGDPRQDQSQNGSGLPMLTNPPDQTKSTMPMGGLDAYQTLPEYLLAVRNPLVFLDWSTNAYHIADLGLNPGQNTITNHYHRGLGQGIDQSVAGGVVATRAVW